MKRCWDHSWLDRLIALSKHIKLYSLKGCFYCRQDKSEYVCSSYPIQTECQNGTPRIWHRWETQCHPHPKIIDVESGEGSPFGALNVVQTHLWLWLECRWFCRHSHPVGDGEAFLSWLIHSVTREMWGGFYHSAISEAERTPNPSEIFIPSSVTKWHENFQSQLLQSPFFQKTQFE